MIEKPQQLAEEYANSIVPNPDKHDAPYYTTMDKHEDLGEAFIKGYEANQSKWISVEDALPSENEEVNVYFETVIKRSQGDINESGVTSCIFTKNEHLRPLFAKDNGWVILGVTHWQYLPNKPI